MPPRSKRPKLDKLCLIGVRRVTYTTIRAVLHALPNDLFRDGGAPTCRNDEFDAMMSKLMGDDLGVILDLPVIKGGTFKWQTPRPQALVRHLSALSPALRRVLRNKPNSHVPPMECGPLY